MRRPFQVIVSGLTVLVALINMQVKAKEGTSSNNGYHAEQFQLTDSELRGITLQVMAQHPVLSSSPGIKYAAATRHRHSHEVADVIYYPHTERAGIKHAFQVRCSRHVPELAWHCDEARVRRYVALDTQDFEVRVTGPIESKEAMALIQATRNALPPGGDEASGVVQTAIMILPNSSGDGYLVTWGTAEGQARLMMEARLPDGANPEDPGGWQVNVFTSDNE